MTITADMLHGILDKHGKWLRAEAGGSRADLRDADLRDAVLSGAALRDADLSRADLSGAALRDADLSRADLSRADLSRSDLSGADLRDADLSRAVLRDAVLSGADLRDADLRDADLPPFAHCPDTGAFTAWKATRAHIVKLLIPATAARTSSIIGRKCRAESAIVQMIYNSDGTPAAPDTVAIGKHGTNLAYRVGAVVDPDSYDPDVRVECTHGIHFFVTVREAVDFGEFDNAAEVTERILSAERARLQPVSVAPDDPEPSAGDAPIRMEVERG